MERKREVPFKRGKLEIWAAVVIQAFGSINFLFDKSCKPYITSKQISQYLDTKATTAANKARIIKDMFDLWYYSPEFSTTKMEQDNPFTNLVMVDDLFVPLDTLLLDIQQVVQQARNEGKDITLTTKYEDQ